MLTWLSVNLSHGVKGQGRSSSPRGTSRPRGGGVGAGRGGDHVRPGRAAFLLPPHPRTPTPNPRSPGPGLRPRTVPAPRQCAPPGSGCWACCGCRVSAGPWGPLSREAPGCEKVEFQRELREKSPPLGGCSPRGVPWPCRDRTEEQQPGTGGWSSPGEDRAPGASWAPGLRVCPSPVLEATKDGTDGGPSPGPSLREVTVEAHPFVPEWREDSRGGWSPVRLLPQGLVPAGGVGTRVLPDPRRGLWLPGGPVASQQLHPVLG